MRRDFGRRFSLILAVAATASVALLGCAFAQAEPSAVGARGGEISFEYFGGLVFDRDVPSPAEALGHAIGERFTQHSDVVRYGEILARESARVQARAYGRTHQGRSLNIWTISSPENLRDLEGILARNRELTDPRGLSAARRSEIVRSNPAIVWLSYNVHGNEASASEAAVQLAYTMAAATNREVEDILEKVVLVIDPMLNPDGRERYVSFFKNTVGAGGANANPDAAEHDEPWPSGRMNHYMFDLNRDWLWLTQPESRARLPMYREYRPQLHIDYHEQGYRSPYFFGAGDDPYNTNIPAETREWVEMYGSANADVFDSQGLVYATKERFDYLYPGYGKVMPCYHGAVGMLCEQAGHGFAGRAVEVSDQYTLTLRERAQHHFLTSMSYLETTAAKRQEQLERFARYFEESMEVREGHPAAIVIHAENDPKLLARTWELCNTHGIEIEALVETNSLSGLRSYETGEELEDALDVQAGSWIIRCDQPMGRLASAVFERETEVTADETYDITGWSLPISYGLDAHYSMEPLRVRSEKLTKWNSGEAGATGDGDVALLIDARQMNFPQAVGIAAQHEIFARATGKEIEIEGDVFGPGSLIIHTIRNPERDLDAFVVELANAGIRVRRVGTGMTTRGRVLGANANWLFELPKVLLVRSEPTSPYSFGQHWWFLDQDQRFPYTAVNADALSRVNLGDYNTLVIPDTWGDLDGALGERTVERIKDWVRQGGALVATGGAAQWASNTVLQIEDEEEEVSKDAEDGDEDKPALNELSWEERRLRRVEENMPGPLLRARVDTTHPLAAGVRSWVGVIKRNSGTLPIGENGHVVARFVDEPRVGGLLSGRNAEKVAGTPFMTHHSMGSGAVICLSDDPTIRGFMHAPTRLLLNAIVYGPSL